MKIGLGDDELINKNVWTSFFDRFLTNSYLLCRWPLHVLWHAQHLRSHSDVLVLPARRTRPQGAEVFVVEEIPHCAANGKFLMSRELRKLL